MPLNESSLCVRCAGSGKTCCQGTRIFLTPGDVARIRSAGEDDFFEYIAVDARTRPLDESVDPVWSRLMAGDAGFRCLRHWTNGDCHFLTPSGCRLAMTVRPLLCRLYPYEYDHNTIKGVNGHLCPLPEARNAPLLLALLGMNRADAELWRRELYREIGGSKDRVSVKDLDDRFRWSGKGDRWSILLPDA